MATLTNPRHERFAVLVANGMSATDAYTGAGFIGRGSTQSASRLARTPAVAARIAELRKRLSDGALTCSRVDREWVMAKLKNIAETAPSASAQIRALELIGKELNMYRELREASVEWDGDLTKLTMPQLLKLAASMKQLEGGPVFEVVGGEVQL
jgi:hypothetical protein